MTVRCLCGTSEPRPGYTQPLDGALPELATVTSVAYVNAKAQEGPALVGTKMLRAPSPAGRGAAVVAPAG